MDEENSVNETTIPQDRFWQIVAAHIASNPGATLVSAAKWATQQFWKLHDDDGVFPGKKTPDPRRFSVHGETGEEAVMSWEEHHDVVTIKRGARRY